MLKQLFVQDQEKKLRRQRRFAARKRIVRNKYHGTGLGRLLHFRLFIPVIRGKKDPKITARGMAIGLGVAMTPLVGIQMIVVGFIWMLQKILAPKWRFSVIVAIAWTWVTNFVTVPLFYYLFLLTGNLMLGASSAANAQNIANNEYNDFYGRLYMAFTADQGFWNQAWYKTIYIFEQWGMPIFIGSVPWIILSSLLGYYVCLIFLRKLHHKHRIKKG